MENLSNKELLPEILIKAEQELKIAIERKLEINITEEQWNNDEYMQSLYKIYKEKLEEGNWDELFESLDRQLKEEENKSFMKKMYDKYSKKI